jgi:hypothetical protein
MMMSLLLQREHELIPSDDDGERAPLVGSPVGRNIGPEHEAASPVPNIVPTPIQAPEGATTVDDVKRQNSTLQLCGNVVLMAN